MRSARAFIPRVSAAAAVAVAATAFALTSWDRNDNADAGLPLPSASPAPIIFGSGDDPEGATQAIQPMSLPLDPPGAPTPGATPITGTANTFDLDYYGSLAWRVPNGPGATSQPSWPSDNNPISGVTYDVAGCQSPGTSTAPAFSSPAVTYQTTGSPPTGTNPGYWFLCDRGRSGNNLTFTFTVAPAAAASLTFVVGIAPTNDDVNEVRLSVGQQTILDRNKVQVRDNSLWLVTAAVPSGETSVSLTMKANSSGNNKDFSIYVGGIALQAVSYCQGIDPNRGWDDEDAVAKIKQILTAIEADGDADLDAPEPHPTGRHLTSGSLLDQQNLRDEVNRTGTGHHGAGSSGPEWDYTAFDDSPYGECKLLEHLYDKVIDSQSQPSPTPQQDADHNVTVTKVAHVCDPLPPGEPTEEDISECLAETSPLPDPIPEVSVNSFVVWEYIVTNNNLFGSVDLQGATIDDDQLPLTCPPRRITPKTTDPSWSLDGSIPVMSWAPGIWQTDTKVPPNGGQASCVMFDRAIQLTPTPTPSEGAGP